MIAQLPFFLLAGGYGKRAQPLSLVKPKPIFPLHGTPLIRLLLNGLKESGLNKGFVNLHYKPEAIRSCIGTYPGVQLDYLYEDELSGSKILVQALPRIKDFLLVINGDVYLEVERNLIERMFRTLRDTGSDGVLLVRENNSPFYSSIKTEKGFFKGTGNREAGSLMYTGAALFTRQVIEAIDDLSFFTSLAGRSFKIAVVEYEGTWLDVGSPRLYFDANRHYVNHLKTGTRETDSESFSEHVVLSPGSRAEGSIIWENTELKGNCRLSNCVVTGNMVLQDITCSDKIIYTIDGEIKITDF